MRKNWIINVSEEPDMTNTTLDNGKSLKQLIIGVGLFLAYVKFRLTTNQDLSHARSSIRDGDSGIC